MKTVSTLLLACGVLVLAASIVTAQKISWNDLRVTYSSGDQSTGFFRLPRTVAAATAEGWASPPELTNPRYQTRCPDKDPTVCVIYNAEGDVNGIEIGIQTQDVANSTYPFARHPMFVRGKRFGYSLYVLTFFTVKPGTVCKKLETGDGLWMDFGPKGVRNFEIPRLQAGIAQTKFTRQNCFPRMGTHYYYNMSPSLRCDDFEPMNGLFTKGEMIGFAIHVWGRSTQLSKKWFESVPTAALKITAPDSPQCMTDLAVKLGLISLHVYFVDKPWTIAC